MLFFLLVVFDRWRQAEAQGQKQEHEKHGTSKTTHYHFDDPGARYDQDQGTFPDKSQTAGLIVGHYVAEMRESRLRAGA